MGYLVLRLFRFDPPDEEEIINFFLNKRRLDSDFSVQTNKKHISKCVIYEFYSMYRFLRKVEGQQLPSLHWRNHVAENIRQEVEYEQVTTRNMSYNVEIMLQKIYASIHGKNCSYYQVIIWLLILEIMLQKKLKKNFQVEYQLANYYFTFDVENYVAEILFQYSFSKGESQLLPSDNLALH